MIKLAIRIDGETGNVRAWLGTSGLSCLSLYRAYTKALTKASSISRIGKHF